jgi:Ras-related protein Rab-5C
VKELQRQAPEAIIIALAGNKSDLSESRAIDTAEAEAYAKEANLLFFETSAKSGVNVWQLFEGIAKKLPLDKGTARGVGRTGSGAGGVDLRKSQTAPGQGCAC